MILTVYDIEISTPLLEPEAKKKERSKEEQRKIFEDQGIKYAEGWRDFANMEIACLAVCEMDLDGDEPDRYRVFAPDTFDRAIELLANAPYIAGYNHKRFDNELVRACFGLDLVGDPNKPRGLGSLQGQGHEHYNAPSRHYDVLEQIWISKGLDPDNFNWGTHSGVGLDAVCEINFKQKKTGRGDRAPFLWLAKRYGEVMDYCLQDVWLTVRLISSIADVGCILDPTSGDLLDIESPEMLFLRRHDLGCSGAGGA